MTEEEREKQDRKYIMRRAYARIFGEPPDSFEIDELKRKIRLAENQTNLDKINDMLCPDHDPLDDFEPYNGGGFHLEFTRKNGDRVIERKTVVNYNPDLSPTRALEMFKDFLMCVGYAENSWESAILAEAEKYDGSLDDLEQPGCDNTCGCNDEPTQ